VKVVITIADVMEGALRRELVEWRESSTDVVKEGTQHHTKVVAISKLQSFEIEYYPIAYQHHVSVVTLNHWHVGEEVFGQTEGSSVQGVQALFNHSLCHPTQKPSLYDT